ncbi:MAG: SDR family NAD(P)-dependent oxidoreductase [Thermodesulfobacteriota bacterium]
MGWSLLGDEKRSWRAKSNEFLEMKLEGKTAIITGAGSGIGRAITLAFAREGARVAIADLNPDLAGETEKTVKDMGGYSLAIQVDVTKWNEVNDMVAEILNTYHTIDILVNNAGITGSQEAMVLHTTPEVEWDRVIAVNLKGVFLCSKRVIPEMIKEGGGKIINTASVAGIVAFPGRAAYTASKGGVALLTKSMALDYAKYKINVNAICPGMIETPMTKWRLDVPELKEQVMGWIPLGRVGIPEDLSGVAVFLASNDSDYITGDLLVVDGGWLAR